MRHFVDFLEPTAKMLLQAAPNHAKGFRGHISAGLDPFHRSLHGNIATLPGYAGRTHPETF